MKTNDNASQYSSTSKNQELFSIQNTCNHSSAIEALLVTALAPAANNTSSSPAVPLFHTIFSSYTQAAFNIINLSVVFFTPVTVHVCMLF